jgi:predicted GNAT family N-acyltransferase
VEIEIKWLAGTDDLSPVRQVRDSVFIGEQGIAPELEYDAMDAAAEHLLICADGRPVAAGRLYQADGQFRFGRVCVLMEYRGEHLGVLVVRLLLARAFAAGAMEVHIHAQAYLEGYYRRFGFVPYGERFSEAGIEHVSMVVRKEEVSGNPERDRDH